MSPDLTELMSWAEEDACSQLCLWIISQVRLLEPTGVGYKLTSYRSRLQWQQAVLSAFPSVPVLSVPSDTMEDSLEDSRI